MRAEVNKSSVTFYFDSFYVEANQVKDLIEIGEVTLAKEEDKISVVSLVCTEKPDIGKLPTLNETRLVILSCPEKVPEWFVEFVSGLEIHVGLVAGDQTHGSFANLKFDTLYIDSGAELVIARMRALQKRDIELVCGNPDEFFGNNPRTTHMFSSYRGPACNRLGFGLAASLKKVHVTSPEACDLPVCTEHLICSPEFIENMKVADDNVITTLEVSGDAGNLYDIDHYFPNLKTLIHGGALPTNFVFEIKNI